MYGIANHETGHPLSEGIMDRAEALRIARGWANRRGEPVEVCEYDPERDEPWADGEVVEPTLTSLDDLRGAMAAHRPDTLDQHGQWRTDLPTFGGAAPADTDGVWSWDEQRLLVGTCADDLEIVARTDQ